MSDFVDFTLKQLEETTKNKTKKEQNDMAINAVARTLEVGLVLFFLNWLSFNLKSFSLKPRWSP